MCGDRFPKSARLLSAADFKQVFRQPERSSDRYFTVLSVETCRPAARLGLAIAKKQIRRAVDRNRLKRIIREVFRRRVNKSTACDFVVMARSAAANTDNPALQVSLQRHFDRLLRGDNGHTD